MSLLELRNFEITATYPDMHNFWRFPSTDAYTGPVWEGGNVLRPVCMTMGSTSIGLSATARILPPEGAVVGLLSIELEARSNDPSLIFRGIVSGNPGDEVVLDLALQSGSLENQIKKETLNLDWFCRAQGVEPWTALLATGPIVIFQIAGITATIPYDRGLEHACTWSGGSPDPALAICQGIANAIHYDASADVGGHTLELLDLGEGDCNDHGLLMEHLCSSVGLTNDDHHIWGGTQGERVHYQYTDLNGEQVDPSLQFEAPETDDVEANPHFTHHVQVEVDGSVYDPCYGTKDSSIVLETAPGYYDQRGSPLPSPKTVVWPCLHSVNLMRDPDIKDTDKAPPNDSGTSVGATVQSIASIDVRHLIDQIQPNWRFVLKRPTDIGYAYRFKTGSGEFADLSTAIYIDPDMANSSWERKRARAEAPPAANNLRLGDEVAIWPPRSESIKGSVLFRRWNTVVRFRARLSKVELRKLGEKIDAALKGLVPGHGIVHEQPEVPGIEIVTGPPQADGSVMLPLDLEAVEFAVKLDFENKEDLELFTPNQTIGRVRTDPGPVYIFFPFRPGRRECTVHALAPTSVVSSDTVWIEIDEVVEPTP